MMLEELELTRASAQCVCAVCAQSAFFRTASVTVRCVLVRAGACSRPYAASSPFAFVLCRMCASCSGRSLNRNHFGSFRMRHLSFLLRYLDHIIASPLSAAVCVISCGFMRHLSTVFYYIMS